MSELELILSVLTHGREELLTLLASEWDAHSGAMDLEASTSVEDQRWRADAGVDLELIPTQGELGVRLAWLPEVHLRTVEETPPECEAARARLKILRSALSKRSAALMAMGRCIAAMHAAAMMDATAALPLLSPAEVAHHAKVEERLLIRVTRNTRCDTPRGVIELHALFET